MSGHPQPAFDLLTAIAPAGNTVGNTVLAGWHQHSDTATKQDDIENYPEVWDSMHLPTVLANLDESADVGVYTLDANLNMNAIAIGLGLENIEYEPERFPGLVYKPAPITGTAVIWSWGLLLSAGGEQAQLVDTITHTVSNINSLGLVEESVSANDVRVLSVGDLID